MKIPVKLPDGVTHVEEVEALAKARELANQKSALEQTARDHDRGKEECLRQAREIEKLRLAYAEAVARAHGIEVPNRER